MAARASASMRLSASWRSSWTRAMSAWAASEAPLLMRAAPSRMVVRALAADRRWLLGCEGACESMLLRMWERGAAIVCGGGGW